MSVAFEDGWQVETRLPGKSDKHCVKWNCQLQEIILIFKEDNT
jgi:hypothetical protein